MESDRISYFEKMLSENPDNPTGLLALANEYGKAGRTEDEVSALSRYVAASEDEGNAYQRLGAALAELGRDDEARGVYAAGIEQSRKFGHEGMVDEMQSALEELG